MRTDRATTAGRLRHGGRSNISGGTASTARTGGTTSSTSNTAATAGRRTSSTSGVLHHQPTTKEPVPSLTMLPQYCTAGAKKKSAILEIAIYGQFSYLGCDCLFRELFPSVSLHKVPIEPC